MYIFFVFPSVRPSLHPIVRTSTFMTKFCVEPFLFAHFSVTKFLSFSCLDKDISVAVLLIWNNERLYQVPVSLNK